MRARFLFLFFLGVAGLGLLAAPILARPAGDTPAPAISLQPARRSLPPFQAPAVSANSGRPVEIEELTPIQDAFIAGQYPFDSERFGKEEFLAVGAYRNLGELIVLLDYAWDSTQGQKEILEAVLFYGVGDGSDLEMPVGVSIMSPFDENTVGWGNSRGGVQPATSTGVLGEVGYWYGIDVTETVRQHPQDGHIRLAIKSNMLAHNFYKGSASRESDPDLSPHLVVRYEVDVTPPQMWFEPLSEWLHPGDTIRMGGKELPNPNRPYYWYLEGRLQGDAWRTLASPTWPNAKPVFTLAESTFDDAGGSIEFRLRGADAWGNVSDWVYAGPAKLYYFDATGQVADHRQQPLTQVELNFDPPAWWVTWDEPAQTYTARLRNRYNTFHPQKTGYGSWGTSLLEPGLPVILPPFDNLLPMGGAPSDPSLWSASEPGDQVWAATDPDVTAFYLDSGEPDRGTFCTKDFFDISAMNQPSLGLRSDTYLIQELIIGWETQGDFHRLYDAQLSGFPYPWSDLPPYRHALGRPCIQARVTLRGGYGFVNIKHLSLGSTRSDLGVTVQHPWTNPPPGAVFPLEMVVANSSSTTATGKLTVQVDGAGESLAWLLPILQPGELFTQTATLTVPPAGAALPFTITVGKIELDDSPTNNIYHWAILPAPAHTLFFPLLREN